MLKKGITPDVRQSTISTRETVNPSIIVKRPKP